MLNRIHLPLGLCAPVKKDPEPVKAAAPSGAPEPLHPSAPDSFALESAISVMQDIPATADDIPESEIKEKTSAGLSRKQAITVIQIQRAEDALKKADEGR